jgi:predicted HicB family RNase H-like nuclease
MARAPGYATQDDLHHRAKAAAAMAGQSLKDFLIEALQAAVDRDEKKRRR